MSNKPQPESPAAPASSRTPTADLAGALRTEVSRLAHSLRQPGLDAGVTPTRLASLAVLARMPDCRPGDLAKQMGVTPASGTRLVDVLVESGWVTRHRDQCDQRVCRLRLTPEGSHLLTSVRREGSERLRASIDALDDAERAKLADAIVLLRRLADAQTRG